MSKHLRFRASAALAALVLCLGSGCASSQPVGTDASTMVVAPGKANGSGVELKYAVPRTIEPGQGVTIQLQLSHVVAAEGAQVELRPGNPELQVLVNGAPLRGAIALTRGEVRTLDVQVSSPVDGVQYLNVFTRQNGRSTASSIPLRIGTGHSRAKPAGDAATTPSGEKIISLPAR